MRTFRSILLMLAIVSGRFIAFAGEPTEQVRATTDKILAILGNQTLKIDPRNTERRQLISNELEQRIDWAGIARSSLGRHWAERTPAEQKEFVTLFSRLLEETSIDKFETNYVELVKIDFLGEKIIDDYASVKAQITTRDQVKHPVEFRLQKSGRNWRAYDVLIEGVGLVKNFRDQFDEILSKSPFEKLIADLRAKLPPESP